MTGVWQTGPIVTGPFTPYHYAPHGQADMFHWDPNPSGGTPSGGAAWYLFVHGGNFTSGSGSQTALTVFGVNDSQLQRGDSDTYPVHAFHINVRQAKTQFDQADFNKHRYPNWASDGIEGIEDVIAAWHFIRANASALGINPDLGALTANSAGTLYAAGAAYHPDMLLSAQHTGRRLAGRSASARPPMLVMQNAPYIPYLLDAGTLIDHWLLSGMYATSAGDRDTRWEAQLTEIQELAPYLLARQAFEEEGYKPFVASAYDNSEFSASLPANFSQNTAHTAICGWHFHRQLEDTFGYANDEHWLGFSTTGGIPAGASAEPWVDTWGNGDYQDLWDQMKAWWTELGYTP